MSLAHKKEPMMQFATSIDLDMLQQDAQRLGLTLRAGRYDLACLLFQKHEHFTLSASGGRMKGEAVSVANDGEFLCLMIDTDKPDALSWHARTSTTSPTRASRRLARRWSLFVKPISPPPTSEDNMKMTLVEIKEAADKQRVANRIHYELVALMKAGAGK